MTLKARQSAVQAGLERGRHQGARLHTTAEPITDGFCVELEAGVATVATAAAIDPPPELAALIQQATAARSAAGKKRGTQQQSSSPCRDGNGSYSRSPSSCNRHIRRRARTGLSNGNKPKALVDSEMEMALAGGSKVAETAMRAVREANAQVRLANLEVRQYHRTSLIRPRASIK